MKIKKMVFCAGLTGTIFYSLLMPERIKFENDVNNHHENECIHNGNIIAHRGFSSIKPENSLDSVKCAVNCDCIDGIEVDVRLTKDNELVLSHNSSISGIGSIKNKTLNELRENSCKVSSLSKITLMKSCILGKDGKLVYDRYMNSKNDEYDITTLNDILDIDSNKTLVVDIKFSKDDNTNFMDKINEIFSCYNGLFNIIFQANNYDELQKMKEKYPEYEYQLIIVSGEKLKYLDSDFNMFAIRKNLITKDIVKSEINKGKSISVWTVNSCYDYEQLKDELGDYINDIAIITDYPDEICYLNNKKEKTKILK